MSVSRWPVGGSYSSCGRYLPKDGEGRSIESIKKKFPRPLREVPQAKIADLFGTDRQWASVDDPRGHFALITGLRSMTTRRLSSPDLAQDA